MTATLTPTLFDLTPTAEGTTMTTAPARTVVTMLTDDGGRLDLFHDSGDPFAITHQAHMGCAFCSSLHGLALSNARGGFPDLEPRTHTEDVDRQGHPRDRRHYAVARRVA